jgi:hypothetical protein
MCNCLKLCDDYGGGGDDDDNEDDTMKVYFLYAPKFSA